MIPPPAIAKPPKITDPLKPFDPSVLVTTTLKPTDVKTGVGVTEKVDPALKRPVEVEVPLDKNGLLKTGPTTKEAPPTGGTDLAKEVSKVCCKLPPVVVVPDGAKPGIPGGSSGGTGPGSPGTGSPGTDSSGADSSGTDSSGTEKGTGKGTGTGGTTNKPTAPKMPTSDNDTGWNDPLTDWSGGANDDVQFMGNVPVYPLPKAPAQSTTFNDTLAKSSVAANPVRDTKFTTPVRPTPMPSEFGNDTPTNRAPIVATVMAQVRRNSSAKVTLLGLDPDANPLSFAIVELSKNGALSGIAPNLKYTPSKGFTGADTFTYFANDGQSNSKPAMVVISVSSSAKAAKATGKVTKSANKAETRK